jgi:hypothetical protein
MPEILDPKVYATWLDPANDDRDKLQLLSICSRPTG